MGWFGGNSGNRTHSAGELKANLFGLSDIHGNVWEWVQDGWDATWYGQFPEKPVINPNSPFSAGSLRVLRGGDCSTPASLCRSATRNATDPSVRYTDIGFRVSLSADAVKESLKRRDASAMTPAPADSEGSRPPLAGEAAWTSLMPGENQDAWSTLGRFQTKDGLLVASGGGSNAISKLEYDDFELEAEWRVLAGGNSGIYYREPPNSAIMAGNEYQLLDDAAYAEKQPPSMQTGSLYGVIAPTRPASKPLGEWNQTRIICRGPVVEHWLNGEQVVRYDTSSAAWRDSLASSSFKNKAAVGIRSRGHILLQAHTGDVAFRGLRIRALAPKMTATPANSEGSHPPLAPKDPDRELAVWALSTSNPNVAIVGREAGSPQVNVLKLADLPAGDFHVTDLVLNVDGETFSDADLERIARVSHLKQINLQTVVFDQACPLVTDRGIEALSRSAFAERLERLSLPPYPSFTDAVIPSLNRFTHLQEFTWKCPSITDAGIQQLDLPELRGYASWSMPYSAESLSKMAARSSLLYVLTLAGPPLGGVDLTPLAKWKLKYLELGQSSLSDVDLPFLGTLTSLKGLNIGNNSGISREGITHLRPLTELEGLDLSRAKVDDESLLLIAGFQKLDRLNLNETLITDRGLETLAGMQALATLHITGCQGVTEAGVRQLEAALPKCQIASDFPESEPAKP